MRRLRPVPSPVFLAASFAVLRLAAAPDPAAAADPWPMFHHDERHTGLAAGAGAIPPAGPTRRWEIQIAPAPATEGADANYRWYSGFPLADLDGNGVLDVVVTSRDLTTLAENQSGNPSGTVWAIRTSGPGSAAPLWAPFQGAPTEGEWGCSDWFDQYSAAATNCDADPRPDLVFTAKGGTVRAVSGATGAVIWANPSGRFIEAGPMVADLDRNGTKEVIVVAGLPIDHRCTPSGPALLVYEAAGSGANPPVRVIPFPTKLDSEEPAIVDLNPPNGMNSKTIVFGSWSDPPALPSGFLYALWFDLATGSLATAAAHADSISMIQIAGGTDGEVVADEAPVVRSSPLVYDFGAGETVVFGWMGKVGDVETARISSVGLAYDPGAGRVVFAPRWTHQRVIVDGVHWPVMDWKPTVALLPVPGGPPLVVSAGGRGELGGQQTGDYGVCTPDAISWVGAFRPDGSLAWGKRYVGVGNIRASCAVANLDGDPEGRNEVVVAFGCTGMLRCYADDGTDLWSYQLGDRPGTPWTRRSIASPSIGDVDGDGKLEIICSAFDGYVTCLGAPLPNGVAESARPPIANLRLAANPTRGPVRASFELAAPGMVAWSVYSSAGRAVRVADLGYRAAGPLAVDWDGRDGAGALVRSGVYVLRIAAGGAAAAEKVAVVK